MPESANPPIVTSQVSVLQAAILLIAADTNRAYVKIRNTGANTVFLGPAGVTTATGHALTTGSETTLRSNAAIYAIATTGTNVVTILEEVE